MTIPANPVVWVRAFAHRRCDECKEGILQGDRMVIYYDRTVEAPKPAYHIKRHYCEPCGKLLEDSLTTTEAWDVRSGPGSRKDL